MAISTYADLKAAIANFAKPNTTLPNGEATDRIPEYIALAEAELNRVLGAARLRDMDEIEPALAITNGVADVPDGFLVMKAFRNAETPFGRITYRPIDQLEAYDPSATGVPQFYDRVGDEFIFWPPSSGTARLRYTKALTPLSDSNTTNWLLTKQPDLYLLKCLLFADLRIDLEEMRPKWQASYDEKLQQVKDLNRAMPEALVPLPNGAIA